MATQLKIYQQASQILSNIIMRLDEIENAVQLDQLPEAVEGYIAQLRTLNEKTNREEALTFEELMQGLRYAKALECILLAESHEPNPSQVVADLISCFTDFDHSAVEEVLENATTYDRITNDLWKLGSAGYNLGITIGSVALAGMAFGTLGAIPVILCRIPQTKEDLANICNVVDDALHVMNDARLAIMDTQGYRIFSQAMNYGQRKLVQAWNGIQNACTSLSASIANFMQQGPQEAEDIDAIRLQDTVNTTYNVLQDTTNTLALTAEQSSPLSAMFPASTTSNVMEDVERIIRPDRRSKS